EFRAADGDCREITKVDVRRARIGKRELEVGRIRRALHPSVLWHLTHAIGDGQRANGEGIIPIRIGRGRIEYLVRRILQLNCPAVQAAVAAVLDAIAVVIMEFLSGDKGCLERADIAVSALRTRHTTLVGGRTSCIVPRVNGNAARTERHRLYGTTIIRERAEFQLRSGHGCGITTATIGVKIVIVHVKDTISVTIRTIHTIGNDSIGECDFLPVFNAASVIVEKGTIDNGHASRNDGDSSAVGILSIEKRTVRDGSASASEEESTPRSHRNIFEKGRVSHREDSSAGDGATAFIIARRIILKVTVADERRAAIAVDSASTTTR